MTERIWRVGLGGSVASGKSTLALALTEDAALREALGGGVEHVDADAVLRSVRAGDASVRDAILEVVPEARAADGTLDTARLADRAFADRTIMARLEAIQWPVLRRLLDEATRSAAARGVRLLLVEGVALERSGIAAELDGIIVVEVDEGRRERRFVARGGSVEDFRRRNRAQVEVSNETGDRGALRIDGNGDRAATVAEAARLLRNLCLGGDHPV